MENALDELQFEIQKKINHYEKIVQSANLRYAEAKRRGNIVEQRNCEHTHDTALTVVEELSSIYNQLDEILAGEWGE